MALAYNKFNSFVEAVALKKHNLGTDTLKLALSNVAPVATNTVFANITEIAAGNGYSAGGNTITTTSCVQTSGVLKLILADSVFTAAGGSIAQWRYIILYNNTATNKELICWWDYTTGLTLTDGGSFTADFDGSAGVFTIT